MKKLMIAAAIVSAAALSQAATFDWTAAKSYAPTEIAAGTKLVDGKHYNSATSGNANTLADQIDDGIASYAYSILLSDDGGVTWSDPTAGTFDYDNDFSTRKISVHGLSNDKFATPTDESKKNIAWKIVITGDYTDEDGTKWTLTSDAITGNADYTKLSAAAIETGVPTGWTATAENVPEPTSGLLLLLGVAGLALKRRRA